MAKTTTTNGIGSGKGRIPPTPLLQEMAMNYLSTRTAAWDRILGWFGSDNLNIDQECKYPLPGQMDAQWFRDMYDRNPIAQRVVQVLPMECWQGSPIVYEDEDPDTDTPFEEAWDKLGRQLVNGQKSFYKDEKGSPIWEYLKRLDILQGIGQFGVLLLGIDDGKNLQDPADGVEVVRNVLTTNAAGEQIETPRRYLVFNRQEDSPAGQAELDLYQKDRDDGRLFTVNSKQLEVMLNNVVRPTSGTRHAPKEPTGPAQSSRGWSPRNEGVQSVPVGSAPPDGAFIQGTDQQYSAAPGLGMAWPAGASLSGTDQQYFGVQFGPSEEMAPIPPERPEQKLLFLRVFDESLVQIVRYEWNITNPRFGLPVMYRITLNDPRQQSSGIGLPLATVYVHWSRVVHGADNLHSSEIFGRPRLFTPARRLLDLERIYGADGIGFWRSGIPGLTVSTHPELGGDADINEDDVAQMVRDYQDGTRKAMVLKGLEAKTLPPSLLDPTPHANAHISAICIMIGCPIRVFMGSERGELASSKDDEAWNERKRERQSNYMTPKLVVPFVDRLIYLGVLPEPDEGYSIKWPDVDALGDKDKAAIALQLTQAMAAYVSGSVEQLLDPIAYLTKVIGWEDAEVQRFIDAAQKAAEDKLNDQMDQAAEQGFKPAPPPGFIDPNAPPPVPGKGPPGTAKPPGAGGSPKPPGGIGTVKPVATASAAAAKL